MRVNGVVGFQTFTSQSLASVQTFSSSALINTNIGIKANAALFSVGGSAGAVRWRDDGGVPTASSGIRMAVNNPPFLYQGDLTRVAFIVDAIAGNADFQVAYYQVHD